MEQRPESGLYNLGTGEARSFLDLVTSTFLAMGKEPSISFIDTPEDIRDKYQYFTQAEMKKLRKVGYKRPFNSLEDGVMKYIQFYLLKDIIH
jgi:ADP-L-glycero-D-manno-heptose 6-epimerase